MSQLDDYRERVLKRTEENKDFIMLEDGFYYFWVKDHGAMNAATLRILADELDHKNAEWEKQIQNDLKFRQYREGF